jgi:putative ABC transport system permease protein
MKAYIISQFIHRPGRALGVMGGIALGAALFITLTSLGAGFRQASLAPLAGVAADLFITRPSEAGAAEKQKTRGLRLPFGSTPIYRKELTAIRGVEGIDQIATALEVWDFGANQYQIVLGMNPEQKQVGPGRILKEGLVSGRVFTGDETGVTVVDRHYAALYSLKPGDTIAIGGESFSVLGIVDQKGSSQAGAANLYIPLQEAQELVGMYEGQVNQVYTSITDASRIHEIVASVTDQIGPVSAISGESILQVMGGVARISSKFSVITSLVGMAGGMALAWVALAGLIVERRREIGIMKALGWRIYDVIRVFMGEVFLLGLFGGVLGIILGSLLSTGIGYLPAPVLSVNKTLPGLSVANLPPEVIHLSATVTFSTLGLALLIVVIVAFLAGWYSVWKLARLKPTKTLQDI